MQMQHIELRNAQLAKTIKNDYFFFDGESATWGTPHPLTGMHNKFGQTYRFKTKEEATSFYNQASYKPVQIIGKARAMRQYHLGVSVADFNEFLSDLEYENVSAI